MASTLGGWYLNGSTLQYRLLDGTTLTSTVLASITGLTGLKLEDGKVMVRGTSSWAEISENDIAVTSTGERTAANPEVATFKISDALLGTSKISVSGSTNYTAYLDLVNDSSKVHIDGTEAITYNNSAGTAVITGDLTKGFTLNKLDGTATSATYSEAKTNQTLATVTGLAKNYTASTDSNAVSTVAFEETKKDKTSGKVTKAGTITLFKVADTENATASTISALGTGAITVNNQAIATNNGINYYLKLGETSLGDYKQQNSTDEAAYWTVKGTTATYQYYSPTGYELTNAKNEVIDREGKVYKADGTPYETNEGDSNATKIKVTAAKTTTVATVTGLANDITTNITDEKVATARENVSNTRSNSIADAVGVGQARITSGDGSFVSGITISGTLTKPKYKADGKTLETDAQGNVTGTGTLSINITKAVLPTKGNVVVTPGKGFKVTATTNTTSGTNDFYTNTTNSNLVKNQRIWVINGNTAVYKEVDLAYYTKTEDENKGTTTISCTVQKDVATLATIKGLNADWLADESHLTRNTTDTNGVITHIDGINITTAAGYNYDDKGKMTAKSGEVGEITLAKEVLDGMNVTITKSDNFKLALQADDVTSVDGTKDHTDTTTNNVVLPAFNNYKWNLSGTTATLKGDIATAGYTLSDDSKTVTYTAAAKNQTLATVSGLKKGTELERDATGNEGANNYRKIGNYVGTTFTDGLAIVTNPENDGGKLTHKTDTNNKTLKRMPITISRLVMDTSKISLTSNFFTLALNKNKTAVETTDSVSNVDSRVYVLEKKDLYDTAQDGTETVKTGLDETVGWHGSLGSTAILKQALPAYYTTVADSAGTIKTINYTKPGTATTLATVKGLNSAINENDIEFDTTTRAIKIKSVDALTTGNVTITNPTGATEDTMYHLELETGGTTGIEAATLSNETWAQTGTTVNYTALVTSPGYKLNADKNLITYTKEATTTPTTLATITGLRAGLAKVDPSTTNDSSGNTDGGSTNSGDTAETDQTFWQYNGVTFNNETGTITIGKEALNGSNIAIKGSANYKLALDTALDKDTAPDAVTRWVISGTTATYKTVIPDYYTYNASNNTITYTKTVDAKYQNATTGKADYSSDESLKGKTIPAFGTIKGLKSNLVVTKEGKAIGYYDNGNLVEEAITLATEADANGKYAITINKAGVLNGTTVSLDATAINNNYTLALSSELAKSQKPQLDGTTTWTIGRGTATLKGNVAAGYSNNSNGTQIDFSAAKNGATIATITGLNSTLTTVGANDLTFGENDGTTDNTNVITVANGMLGTSDVKLTTNIAILGKDYKLALDAYSATNPDGTKQKSDVTSTEQNRWSIDKTTATYYTWRDTYYSLENSTGTASDTITYHAAGEGLKTNEDVLATVTGLASGLVTIQNDQIRGITVNDTEGTITLSSNVLPTTIGSTVQVTPATGKTYTLILDSSDSSIPTPKNALTFTVQKTGIATVDIKRATSAGFAYEGDTVYDESSQTGDKTKLVYLKEDLTGDGKIGTITGLNKDGVVLKSDGTIDGINVNENSNKITLSKNVLTNRDVTFTNTSEAAYSLELDSDVASSSSGPTWQAGSTSGQFVLRAGVTNGGFGSATTTDKVTTIPYVGGGNAGTEVATISGLKNTNGIVVDETAKTIIINLDNLNAKDVEFVSNTSNYTLALQNDSSKDGYVAESATENSWDLTKGTATYTQKTSAGYKVDSGKIVYTPESSIVSTLNNLNQEKLFISTDKTKLVTKTEGTDEDGNTTTTENDAIIFADNKFTVSQEDALAHKSVKLTTKATGKDSGGKNVTANYTLELASGLQATTAAPVWNKAANSTVATYTATTAAGYTISGDNKNIVYNSDPTTATLATVNGLNKDCVAYTEGGKSYVGIATTTTDDSTGETITTTNYTKGLEVTTDQSGDVITIGNNVLNGANVTLANGDKYKFELDANVPDSDDETKIWAVSGTKATYKKVIPAYYALDNNGRTVKYTKQADVKDGAITTISGLKSGLTPSADGSTISGLTFDDEDTPITVYLDSTVLGTSKITSDNLKIAFLSTDTNIIKKATDTTGWVANGTTYTYKKYTQAYYVRDNTGEKTITYNAPKDITTYATISNLASGATISYTPTDDTTLAKGGTIEISADQLNKKDVTLKVNSGDFKLAFAQGFDEKATIGDGTWSKKNATTAELTATKSVGYTLSEDAKSITYQKAEGTVTLATISGLKSGFELLKDSDVKTETDGTKTITLSKEQLGTANVTLKGDGYKLALATTSASETDDAGWVKAANATKATFTQQTYNGFTESADGKTLTYIKNTSKIDLATINGLSKDLTTAQMAIVYKDSETGDVLDAAAAKEAVESAFDDDGALVVIDDVNKVIHVKKEALSGKVTLGNKDGYTFALADDNDNDGIIGGDELETPKLTFNNGTMSIVNGTNDKWELSSDAKTLNWTKSDYKTLATVSGLPKTLTYTAGAEDPIQGIEVNDNTITINENALVKSDGTSLLNNNAKITLTNNTVGETTSNYSITLGTGLNGVDTAPTAADKKKWVLSGTNLSLKEVTSKYYLKQNPSNTTQTITYVAEKVGSDLAKISGLPSGMVKQTTNGQKVYVGDDSTDANNVAFSNTLVDTNSTTAKDDKEITLGSAFLNSIKSAGNAVTLTLTPNNSSGYKFAALNSSYGEPTDGDFGLQATKSYTALKTAGKATVIKTTTDGWTQDENSHTKIIFSKAVDSVTATISGLNKNFDHSATSNDLAFDANDKKITVGAAALTTSNVTLAIPKGDLHTLALGSNVASTLNHSDDKDKWFTKSGTDTSTGWKNQTEWVVSGGTASYKTYDHANYYLKDNGPGKPNSIVYVAPTKGYTYATINGLNKTATTDDIDEGTEVNDEIIITLGKAALGTSKVTLGVSKVNSVANANEDDVITDLNEKIEDGTEKAAKYKLALNLDDTSADSVTASSVKSAVWDNNGTVANLTGTITKGYKLSNDQKSITYQAADSKLQVIAKVSGIKKDSQILDSNVTPDTSNEALPNLKKITLKNEHLGTSNVVLTGEGYKLALDAYDATNNTDGVITDDNADIWTNATEWVANNGTFTYKTYNKAHYRVNDTGMQVIYTAAKDDKNNADHKTYAQITGLSKTADASALNALATTTKGGEDASYAITSITTANDGVITLTSDLLNKGNIKLTDSKISASLEGMPVLYTGGYTLALDDNVTKSTASNVNATVSGTKATWSGTQGAGYLLANDEQNVTYYSAKKDKQTIATVTGLNASVTAENSNDSLSSSYDAATNVMKLTKDKLSTNVGISGTVAYNFSDFENGTITGSGSADKVSIAGDGVSINAGGGNDIVEFTASSRTKGNTFLYANGNGDDVIKGFTANDVIKVTNVVGTTSTSKKVGDDTVYTYKNNIEVYTDEKNASDALVKVNNNVIRIKGMGSNIASLTVLDKNDYEWDSNATTDNGSQTKNGSFVPPTTDPDNVLADDDYAMTPQNLFADDNYAMTPNLSSIVKSSTSSDYATDDLVADDATALTKQSTAVSYSDKK